MILYENMKPVEDVLLHPICVAYFLTWCGQRIGHAGKGSGM